MKKIVITLAVLGAAAGAAQAQSSVTIYGALDAYLESGRNGQATVTRVQNGGAAPSRIGFRGVEDLGGGVKAIFSLETGINVDDGTAAQGGLLFGRQAFVGLSGNFGTVTLGRQYTPFFMTNLLYTLGGGMGWGNAANYFLEPPSARANNALQYATPNMNGFVFKAMYALGENPAPGAGKVGNVRAVSGQYDSGKLSVNVSHMNRTTTDTNADKWTALGASYDFTVVKTALVYQVRRDDANLARNDYFDLSATIPMGGGALLLDIGGLQNKATNDADARTASIRYDYFLSKRTTVYGGFSTVRNEAKARYGVTGAGGAPMVALAGADPRALAIGVRHFF
ncbi:MAG: porin [Telluria sp.]